MTSPAGLVRAAARRVALVDPRRRAGAGLAVAVAGWVAGLVLVAAVGEAVVVQRVDRRTDVTTVPAPTAPTGAEVPGTAGALPPSVLPALPGILGIGPTPAAADPPFDLGISDPLESGPPTSPLLPPLPVIELPPLPAELRPLVALTSPSARQVCSTTGVVIVLSALVKGDLEEAGVPVSQALTYLGPVLAACALFPEDEPSICAVDNALNEALVPEDLRLLVGVPPLGALGLDQVASVESALASTGLALPPFTSDLIAQGLGCDLR